MCKMKKQIATLSNNIESIADERFEDFKRSNPIVAKTMVQLSIRDPKMAQILKIIWRKGYACGMTDATLNIEMCYNNSVCTDNRFALSPAR